MSITLKDLKTPITGIVHIGAGTITEVHEYNESFNGDIYWFEAIYESYLIGNENIAPFPNHKQFNVTLSDNNDIHDYYITSNSGSSSSLLPLKIHLQHHPKAQVIETRQVQCRRFDDFINEQNIDTSKLNILIVDVQGAELKVLKGMTKHLEDNVEEIVVEVNLVEMYENNPTPEEIEKYLNTFNFKKINRSVISRGQAEDHYLYTED